jgi:hypothetical protein
MGLDYCESVSGGWARGNAQDGGEISCWGRWRGSSSPENRNGCEACQLTGGGLDRGALQVRAGRVREHLVQPTGSCRRRTRQ